jgi:hypothetical protein
MFQEPHSWWHRHVHAPAFETRCVEAASPANATRHVEVRRAPAILRRVNELRPSPDLEKRHVEVRHAPAISRHVEEFRPAPVLKMRCVEVRHARAKESRHVKERHVKAAAPAFEMRCGVLLPYQGMMKN